MLHEDIKSVAHALDSYKYDTDNVTPDLWRLLHNAAANLHSLADSVRQVELHFVPAAQTPNPAEEALQ